MVRPLGLALGLLGLALVLGVTLPAVGEDKPDELGFMDLFNGKDLTGWKIHDKPNGSIESVAPREKDGKVIAYIGKTKDGKEIPLWRVEEGILIGGGPSSHLFSERGDYENFVYRVEAMINDKGNSGQYFRTAVRPRLSAGL